MYYNLTKILSRTTLALFFALLSISIAKAQTVSLSEDADSEVLNIDSDLPDEISLFDDSNDGIGLVQPTEKISAETSAPQASQAPFDEEISFSETSSVATPQSSSPFGASAPVSSDSFGDQIISQTDEKIFSQMSDLERQTALLTLELRREKIKTEIEAIKFQRQKALEEDEEAKERKRREKIEWETEQQKKLLAEQAKLKAEEVNLEKIRQEKIIKAYKNHMLEENKKWMETLKKSYDAISAAEAERDSIINEYKVKFTNLRNLAKKITNEAVTAKENYKREVEGLQTQISVLNARITALSTAQGDGDIQNPFSQPGFGTSNDPNLKLSDEYIVLEIKGRGENLTAKISNKSGAEAFLVQKGTVLKSGHIIEEIAPTFIRADRGGLKDFIYFSAGGILDKEPDSENKIRNFSPLGAENGNKANANDDKEKKYIPQSFMEGMFVK